MKKFIPILEQDGHNPLPVKIILTKKQLLEIAEKVKDIEGEDVYIDIGNQYDPLMEIQHRTEGNVSYPVELYEATDGQDLFSNIVSVTARDRFNSVFDIDDDWEFIESFLVEDNKEVAGYIDRSMVTETITI